MGLFPYQVLYCVVLPFGVLPFVVPPAVVPLQMIRCHFPIKMLVYDYEKKHLYSELCFEG